MVNIKRVGKIVGLVLAGIIVVALISHTVFDIYVKAAFRKEARKMKERGEPVSYDDFPKATVPDDQNAATIYMEVFLLIDAGGDDFVKIQEVKRKANFSEWTDEQREEIPAIMAKHDEVFELLHEAALKPHCSFALDHTDFAALERAFEQPPFGRSESGVYRAAAFARFLSLRAALDEEDEQMDKAIERISDGLATGTLYEQTNTLLGAMFGIACDNIMLDRLKRILTDKDISGQSYQRLYDSLEKQREKQMTDVLNGLRGEVCRGIMMFEQPSVMTITWSEARRWLHWPLVTFLRWDMVRGGREMAKVIEAAKKPYWEVSDEEMAITSWTPLLGGRPDFWRFVLRAAGNEAQLGTAELAVALIMYKNKNGDYPASLKELVPDIVRKLPLDPFTGKDFVYRKEEDGFIVYSLGENAKDDGGDPGKLQWSEDGDIVWKFGG